MSDSGFARAAAHAGVARGFRVRIMFTRHAFTPGFAMEAVVRKVDESGLAVVTDSPEQDLMYVPWTSVSHVCFVSRPAETT